MFKAWHTLLSLLLAAAVVSNVAPTGNLSEQGNIIYFEIHSYFALNIYD